MPDWTSGEERRQAIYRDEYQRPKGKHRAQAPKPAQAGPSLPAGLREDMTTEVASGGHRAPATREPPRREPPGCPTPGACSCPGTEAWLREAAYERLVQTPEDEARADTDEEDDRD